MKVINTREEYLKKIKQEKLIVFCLRFLIIFIFLILWEFLAKFNLINTFLFSSPSRILKVFLNLPASEDSIWKIQKPESKEQ